MIRRFGIAFFLVFLVILPSLSSQVYQDEPDWLLLERERMAVSAGELGTALTLIRTVQGRADDEGRAHPEADLWIGYIFEQEGEWALAEEQYRRVLENRDALYVAEDAFTVLYRLAGIYEKSSRYGSYEGVLKQILTLDRAVPGSNQLDPRVVERQEAVYRLFLRDGMNKLFILYREDRRKYQMAYTKLGVFTYRTGLYRESIQNLLQALMTPVTNLVEQVRLKDFSYQFAEMEELIPRALESPEFSSYLQETFVPEILYYLGASLFAYGEIGRADEVWRLLLLFPDHEPYRARAVRQLSSPFVEPLLVPQELPEP